jgi:hypothetical protein
MIDNALDALALLTSEERQNGDQQKADAASPAAATHLINGQHGTRRNPI